MNSSLSIDVVTCSIDGELFRRMKSSVEEALSGFTDLQFFQMRDAKSMAHGYNDGLSLGSSDWVLFCHEDIQLLQVDQTQFTKTLECLDVIGVCGNRLCQTANWYNSDPSNIVGSVVTPTPDERAPKLLEQFGVIRGEYYDTVQCIDGVFILVKRSVAEKLRFSEDIPGFTCYDVDFSYRAFLHNKRVGVTSALAIFHDNLVSEYSEEKLRKWKENMALLERKYNFYRKFPDGSIHKTQEFVS